MSNAVFPTLAGLGWSIKRAPQFKTRKQVSISGKETAIADMAYPRWEWELTFNVLRQGTRGQSTFSEMSDLVGFYNERQGGFDTFLYQDQDDNSVTGQALGEGDGTTTAFQLVRSFGGFVEPVLAPNAVSAVYLNGVKQTSGYAVSSWGATSPGVVTFTSAPGAGVAVTADFTFYFPCRFVDDTMSFEKFMATLYSAKSVKFQSIK